MTRSIDVKCSGCGTTIPVISGIDDGHTVSGLARVHCGDCGAEMTYRLGGDPPGAFEAPRLAPRVTEEKSFRVYGDGLPLEPCAACRQIGDSMYEVLALYDGETESRRLWLCDRCYQPSPVHTVDLSDYFTDGLEDGDAPRFEVCDGPALSKTSPPAEQRGERMRLLITSTDDDGGDR